VFPSNLRFVGSESSSKIQSVREGVGRAKVHFAFCAMGTGAVRRGLTKASFTVAMLLATRSGALSSRMSHAVSASAAVNPRSRVLHNNDSTRL
jgi:hypothetical protein